MPPLTLESAGALVPGGGAAPDTDKEKRSMQAQQKAAQPATLTGVVERAFYYQGKPTKVGEKLMLPRIFALEMEAANKLRLVADAPAPAPQAAAQEADAGGKKEKEKGNAR